MLPSITEFVALADRVAPVLLDTAIRSVVVLGLAGCTAMALHRGSAAARHWVWLLGLAGLLMLPVLSATLPGWRVLPRLDMKRAAPIAFMTIEAPPTSEFVEQQQTGTPMPSPAAGEEATPVVPVSAPSQGAAPPEHISIAASAPRIAVTPRIVLPWTFWLVVIWFVGSLLVLGHLLLGYLSLWFLQRRCAQITHGDWVATLKQLRRELEVHRHVELLSTRLRTMPMTWGLWRTRLLLPEHADSWEPEQRRSVLMHELAHVRRFDCLTQFLAQIVYAVYWFNPLVWLAWGRMQLERERACDDLVLNAGAKASAYAGHLLHSASSMPALRFVGAAALAMARASTLEERLRAILDAQRNRRALTRGSIVATTLLLLGALLPVAALRAQEDAARGPTTAPAVAPNQASLTIEEQMRLRRQQVQAEAAAAAASGLQVLPPPVERLTCPLDAMIYEVRLPVDQIGKLDVSALTRASSNAEEFEKALAALGTEVPLYRANQSVQLAGDSIGISQSTPYVTGSRVGANGEVLNTVQYSRTGALFNLAGTVFGNGRIELDLSVELSSLTDGATVISNGIKAPNFRQLTMSRKGMVDANRPFIVVTADGATTDTNGKAVAYIARVTLGAPQSAKESVPGE